MNFCSECGSSRLVIKIPASDNRKRIVCESCDKVHYINPRVVAGCIAVWEKKILLCRRAIEPRQGFWNLPAGFLEVDESLESGAAREVMEEAEAEIINLRLHSIYSNLRHQYVYVHFIGEIVNGQFGAGEESLESRLFTEEEIPWSELAFYSSEYALKKYFEDRVNDLFKVHIGSWPA